MIDLVTQFKDRRPGARPAAARLGLRGARRGGAPMLPCPIARLGALIPLTGPGSYVGRGARHRSLAIRSLGRPEEFGSG